MRGAPNRSFGHASFDRLGLPKNVYDQPASVPAGEVEIVNPIGSNDLRAGRASIDVQD